MRQAYNVRQPERVTRVLDNMPVTVTVARREFAELKSTRSTVGSGVLAIVFFTVAISGDVTVSLDVSLTGLLVVRPLFTGLFLAYYGSSQVFQREKTDGIIETLLCSPATLRQMWCGKTLAVAVFASMFAFAAALVTLAIPIANTGAAVLPDGATVLYILVVLPLVLACAVGARGHVQLRMGMRESHFVSLAVVVILVLVFGAVGFVGLSAFGLSPGRIALMALAAAIVLAVLTATTSSLSRERIVTSL